MKFREYFFIALIVISVVWFMQPSRHAGPTPDNQRPVLTGIVKLAKWLGWAAMFAEEAPPAPQQAPVMVQADPIPPEVVNESPVREKGPDGVAQLKHSEGW